MRPAAAAAGQDGRMSERDRTRSLVHGGREAIIYAGAL